LFGYEQSSPSQTKIKALEQYIEKHLRFVKAALYPMPRPPNRSSLSDEQALSVIRKPWEISIP